MLVIKNKHNCSERLYCILGKRKQRSLLELPGFSLQPWTRVMLDEGSRGSLAIRCSFMLTGRKPQQGMQYTVPGQLVNGITPACMIILVWGACVTDTNRAGLFKDGKVWLLLGCRSDVSLKYTETKSSEKPKCCFIEPEVERIETSETRSLWSPGTSMMLDAELQCIQWHRWSFSLLHYPGSWSTVMESRSCHKMSNLTVRHLSSETFPCATAAKGFVFTSAFLCVLYLCTPSFFSDKDLGLLQLTLK